MNEPVTADAPEGLPVSSKSLPGPTPSLTRSRLLVLLAATMWSTSGFFVKAPHFSGWPGPTLACWRAVFACLILWPLVRQPRWNWRLVPMVICFVGLNYSYLTALATGTAANAIWLQSLSPVWVLLVGVFVFHEPAVWRDWLLVALAALGVAIILYFESGGESLAAVSWALTASVCFAGVVLALRQLRDYDPAWLAALNLSVTAIALAPFALADKHFPSGMQWLFLAGLGMFQMGLPYVLFARGLKGITGHEASGILLVEPLLMPLWAYLAWGDQPAWWTLVGGGLILLGLVIRYGR